MPLRGGRSLVTPLSDQELDGHGSLIVLGVCALIILCLTCCKRCESRWEASPRIDSDLPETPPRQGDLGECAALAASKSDWLDLSPARRLALRMSLWAQDSSEGAFSGAREVLLEAVEAAPTVPPSEKEWLSRFIREDRTEDGLDERFKAWKKSTGFRPSQRGDGDLDRFREVILMIMEQRRIGEYVLQSRVAAARTESQLSELLRQHHSDDYLSDRFGAYGNAYPENPQMLHADDLHFTFLILSILDTSREFGAVPEGSRERLRRLVLGAPTKSALISGPLESVLKRIRASWSPERRREFYAWKGRIREDIAAERYHRLLLPDRFDCNEAAEDGSVDPGLKSAVLEVLRTSPVVRVLLTEDLPRLESLAKDARTGRDLERIIEEISAPCPPDAKSRIAEDVLEGRHRHLLLPDRFDASLLLRPDETLKGDECPICADPMERPYRTPGCQHAFCLTCLRGWVWERRNVGSRTGWDCPICRHPYDFHLSSPLEPTAPPSDMDGITDVITDVITPTAPPAHLDGGTG